MKLEFAKMSGAGNDFIVVDDRSGAVAEDAGELAKQLCRRRVSVGADGLILIVKSTAHSFRMRYFNADGSEADMCGNGGRCVARFAHERSIAKAAMSFESRSGVHRAEIIDQDNVKLTMTEPRAMLLGTELYVSGELFTVHRINTGVPHAVIEVADLDSYPVVETGRAVREHVRFTSEGTNVDFVTVDDEHHVRLRTYERGVEDETLACGTGAVATALIMSTLEKTKPPVTVMTHGGKQLTVDFFISDTGFCDVSLTGDARVIYWGDLDLSEE
ncbi:diaminopimelate epimerase [bacterium]|nr:diaminopimelate epimerase [bacterium]